MDLLFSNARNGQLTCSANGRYLHSSFNPQIEAERFVKTVSCTFEPSAIIVTGACLSHCISPLKEKYRGALLIAVQYDYCFEQYSSEWDKVYFITNKNDAISFSSELFNLLGEEKLMTTLFTSWKPSETVWIEENRLFWESVKNCMEKAQSVLTTRNWFNVRWFKNTIKNLSAISKFTVLSKTNLPIIVTASGPSLSHAISFLKANRNHFRLMAASSSITTLLENDIIPDACISTDGGWYATRHLRCYQTDSRLQDVPLIISGESAVPSALYDSVPFVLLSYGDGVETLLSTTLKLPTLKGLRNGTVSGTAAALAASLTTDCVYICGLDLAPGKGFQHAEPNENDVPLFSGQSRLNTIETAQSRSRYGSGSLALYREWFSTQGAEFTSRIFRLVSTEDSLEPIGSMKDIVIEQLSFNNNSHITASSIYEVPDSQHCSSNKNKEKIREYLSSVTSYMQNHPDDSNNNLWFSTLAIKSYISWLRMKSDDKKTELCTLINETTSVIKEVLDYV